MILLHIAVHGPGKLTLDIIHKLHTTIWVVKFNQVIGSQCGTEAIMNNVRMYLIVFLVLSGFDNDPENKGIYFLYLNKTTLFRKIAPTFENNKRIYGLNSRNIKKKQFYKRIFLGRLIQQKIARCGYIDSYTQNPTRDADDPSKYRPISITPALAKVFEKILQQQMIEYLDKNRIFSSVQFGFKKQFSTTDALLYATEKIRKN